MSDEAIKALADAINRLAAALERPGSIGSSVYVGGLQAGTPGHSHLVGPIGTGGPMPWPNTTTCGVTT